MGVVVRGTPPSIDLGSPPPICHPGVFIAVVPGTAQPFPATVVKSEWHDLSLDPREGIPHRSSSLQHLYVIIVALREESTEPRSLFYGCNGNMLLQSVGPVEMQPATKTAPACYWYAV